MGLGLLGGALNDARYLAEQGAELTITDLKTAEELKPSLDKLKGYKNIKFVLGEHRLEDFRKADLILQPGNVPLDSPYLAEAKKNNIPVFVSESLFSQQAKDVTLVGVTGTRGKSTTTQIIYEIIKASGKRVFLAGNVKNVSTLSLLGKIKSGDIVVLELDSWALHGMGDIKRSPNIAVFTNLMIDHQNYYKNNMDLYFADKANIFLNQKEGDSLVCGADVLKLIRKKYKKHAGRAIVPDAGVIPKGWKIKLLGEHNKLNIAYAITVARIMDVPEKIIKQTVENFAGISGRLEFVREVKGIKYYNDTTATTPDGVIAALKALDKYQGKIILIGGGRDKELDYKKYVPVVKKSVKGLVLFKGTATDKIIKALGKTKLPVFVSDNMPEAFAQAQGLAQKGDIALLSPGAASFGIFKNEFDRGDQFVNLVKKLK